MFQPFRRKRRVFYKGLRLDDASTKHSFVHGKARYPLTKLTLWESKDMYEDHFVSVLTTFPAPLVRDSDYVFGAWVNLATPD